MPAAPEQVVGDGPALAAGRPGQRDRQGRPADGVHGLDRVTHAVDGRVGGAQLVIHQQGATGAERETGGCGERRLRTYPGRQQDQVGGQRGTAGQVDERAAAGGLTEPRDRGAQPHVHPGPAEFQFDAAGHLRIQRGQDLAGQLDHGDVQAAVAQRLGHLQADEPGTHQHRPPGPAVDQAVQRVRVRDRPQGPDRGQIRAGHRRDHGCRAGGQHERVVGLVILAPGRAVPHPDTVLCGADRENLVPGAHVQGQAPGQGLRRVQQERVPVADLAGQVVGEPAVSVGHVRILLQHHDLRLLGEAPGPGREAHPAGHPADHDRLHRPQVQRRSAGTLAGTWPACWPQPGPGDLLAPLTHRRAAHGRSSARVAVSATIP